MISTEHRIGTRSSRTSPESHRSFHEFRRNFARVSQEFRQNTSNWSAWTKGIITAQPSHTLQCFYIHIYMCVYIYIYIYIHTHTVYTHVYTVCTYMYIYIYIYTHIHYTLAIPGQRHVGHPALWNGARADWGQKIAHQKSSTPQKSSWIFSGVFQWIFMRLFPMKFHLSVVFSKGLSLPQWIYHTIV